ncbi:aldo/keto reductase [Streptomyces chitinivorans]|uniref:Aldo/keto reductase n=1 Tax=Streptomyces chitinivorans TaxID=1257027 RepID=A0ABW7HY51_9ACTN|nr:aldo/keto reductase [Streptomyces chitinivorans]MDH2407814.1 aldo/keto reductase [Streptomyces chitinivorans]
MSRVPTVVLNNGVEMPRLGFGVWQVPDEDAPDVVATALAAGYRKIDTAAAYYNEAGTGKGIAASGVDRADVFVTTKVWNTDHGYDATLRAFDASLDRLGLDHVDLYLIHWPVPHQDRYVDTYRALERIYADGRARAIGVSNFLEEHLDRLADETSVVPAVNQIELHPQHQQARARALHAERGIVTEAWSPLGSGRGLLGDPVIGTIARKHGRSPAQVVLRWSLQLGNVVIPKSADPARIAENTDLFGFTLDDEDMSAVAALELGRPLGPARKK